MITFVGLFWNLCKGTFTDFIKHSADVKLIDKRAGNHKVKLYFLLFDYQQCMKINTETVLL